MLTQPTHEPGAVSTVLEPLEHHRSLHAHGRYDVHTAADELVAPMVYFAKLNASDGSVAHRPPRALWGTRGVPQPGPTGPYVVLQ